MKRPDRPLDLWSLLTEDVSFGRLSGSGVEQAPLIVDALCAAGMKAVHQPSPPGVAVYLEPACGQALEALPREHALLWLMCGLAPAQAEHEREYSAHVRVPLIAQRFSRRLRQLRPRADLDVALRPLEDVDATSCAADDVRAAEALLDARMSQVLPAAAVAMDVAVLSVEREWQALLATHCTLANACLTRYLAASAIHLQDAKLITSADPKRVRLSLLLYDAHVHEAQQRPRPFRWVPCLAALVAAPSAATLGEQMTAALWGELRTVQHYHPPRGLVEALAPTLEGWFASCVTTHGGLSIRATLSPQRQLCFYLHGAAGSGKSSLLRALLPALVAVVRRFLHPESIGGFVKQTLNKPLLDLSLEFERRPNNNDLSVVTVIETAREPLSAMEPRLLLLGLEEMPPAEHEAAAASAACSAGGGGADGDRADDASDDGSGGQQQQQEAVCGLLAERLRKSCHHPDLFVCLTSNYALTPAARATLTQCKAFANLVTLEVAPPEDDERRALALALLRSHLGTAAGGASGGVELDLQLSLGAGDVRPLVRHIRSLAVFAKHLLSSSGASSAGKTRLTIREEGPVDVREVKMNRALYDPRETRSLRDEILDLKACCRHVAVELVCGRTEDEMVIREMVEDSPSLVAHSVHKRILHKDGLLFVVRAQGATAPEGVTPELRSRASVVL